MLTFECVRNSNWNDFPVWGDILATWRLLFDVLDDRFGHPVVHRDTPPGTPWGLALDFIDFRCVLGFLGSHFRDLLRQSRDLGCPNGIWD